MFEHLPSETIISMFSTASAAMVVCIATLVSIPNSLIVALKIDIASMILVFNCFDFFAVLISVGLASLQTKYRYSSLVEFTNTATVMVISGHDSRRPHVAGSKSNPLSAKRR